MSHSRYHPAESFSNLNVIAFDSGSQAVVLREALLNLQGESLFHLDELVVVTRDEAGQVQLHDSAADHATGGAVLGSLVGAIVGAMFLVPGLGTAVGAGVGAVLTSLADLGIEDGFMKELGSTMKPGTSALFMLGKEGQLDELGRRLGPLLKGGALLHTTVNTEREAEIRKLLHNQGN